MKKILLPTDFSIKSLQLIEYAVLNFRETPIDILLVSGYRLPWNSWDLVNFSHSRELRTLTDRDYLKAKAILLQEHSHEIRQIETELFTGTNGQAFRHFIERHEVTDALIPSEKFLNYKSQRTFDPSSLIRKHVNTVKEVSLANTLPQALKPQLSF